MIIGSFEYVDLPEFGVENVMAKVDTGAYSGAMHCTNIRIVRRGPEKKRILKFTPLNNELLASETDNFIETYIRSATGHRMRRYVVDTRIILRGKEYPIRIGISDRSPMKRPVLIGRRFLRDNNIIVDARVNSEHDDEGERTR